MTSADHRSEAASTVRAAFDVLVCAPLGFGAMLIENSPAAISRARQELSNARFIGRFAVDQGVAQMRSRLEDASSQSVRPSGAPVPPADPLDAAIGVDDADTASDAGEVDPAVDEPDVAGILTDDVPVADDLALPDYETLPAIDIVAKLANLGVDDRLAIERYETAHRQRRTVLGKLAQLAEQ